MSDRRCSLRLVSGDYQSTLPPAGLLQLVQVGGPLHPPLLDQELHRALNRVAADAEDVGKGADGHSARAANEPLHHLHALEPPDVHRMPSARAWTLLEAPSKRFQRLSAGSVVGGTSPSGTGAGVPAWMRLAHSSPAAK